MAGRHNISMMKISSFFGNSFTSTGHVACTRESLISPAGTCLGSKEDNSVLGVPLQSSLSQLCQMLFVSTVVVFTYRQNFLQKGHSLVRAVHHMHAVKELPPVSKTEKTSEGEINTNKCCCVYCGSIICI